MNIQTSTFQISIFAPWNAPFGPRNWAEQILGEIVLPLVHDYSSQIDAIWMTRYTNTMSHEPYDGLEQRFIMRQGGQDYWRHVKLRFLVRGDEVSLKEHAESLIQNVGCAAPQGWQSYDYVADLGGDRFIISQANHDEREQRAKLIFRFMDATIRLMLDAIQKNDQGEWWLEANSDHRMNPEGVFFQSIHHLFCNATAVPTIADLGFLLPSGELSWARVRVEF